MYLIKQDSFNPLFFPSYAHMVENHLRMRQIHNTEHKLYDLDYYLHDLEKKTNIKVTFAFKNTKHGYGT